MMVGSYSFYAVLGIPAPAEWSSSVGAATIAGIAALASVLAATVRGPRERRRELYGRAFRDALAWQEGLYRVRRRSNTAEHDRELIDRMHDLQERIEHHRGWIASESIPLSRSYCRFVAKVKDQTQPLMRTAWGDPGRPAGSPEHQTAAHPTGIDAAADRFLLDVRLHLWSSLLIPTLVLWARNRKPTPPSPPPPGGGPPSP